MTARTCRACNGSGQFETLVVYNDEPGKVYRYPCRGCRGTGQTHDREFVKPESLTWCISETCGRAFNEDGLILTKAHHTKAVDIWHKPVCGAAVAHTVGECVPAPVGWPQCRKCSRQKPPPVPAVFEEALT